MTATEVTKMTGKHISTIYRRLGSVGDERQVYVKDGEEFYPVGETTIKVIDTAKMDEVYNDKKN